MTIRVHLLQEDSALCGFPVLKQLENHCWVPEDQFRPDHPIFDPPLNGRPLARCDYCVELRDLQRITEGKS